MILKVKFSDESPDKDFLLDIEVTDGLYLVSDDAAVLKNMEVFKIPDLSDSLLYEVNVQFSKIGYCSILTIYYELRGKINMLQAFITQKLTKEFVFSSEHSFVLAFTAHLADAIDVAATDTVEDCERLPRFKDGGIF